jgi:hypothetical protein
VRYEISRTDVQIKSCVRPASEHRTRGSCGHCAISRNSRTLGTITTWRGSCSCSLIEIERAPGSIATCMSPICNRLRYGSETTSINYLTVFIGMQQLLQTTPRSMAIVNSIMGCRRLPRSAEARSSSWGTVFPSGGRRLYNLTGDEPLIAITLRSVTHCDSIQRIARAATISLDLTADDCVGFMRKVRVLIADDHEMILASVRVVLGETFDIVSAVKNGLDAVTEVQRLDPDVLVIDISMPILDGLQAVSQLRSLNLRTRVVFLNCS